jgi:hypothetical protein
MDEVKIDLKTKISQLEGAVKDKKKNEDVVLLKSERDFFRSEAIRLNGICQDQVTRFENLRKEYEVKLEEEKAIIRKWKDAENINKQIFLELENNLKIIKKLEKEKKNLEKKKGYDINNINHINNPIDNPNENNNNNNYEKYNMKVPNLNNMYSNYNNSFDKNLSKIKDTNTKLMNSTLYNSNSKSEIIEENNNLIYNQGNNSNSNNINNFGTSMISFNVKDNLNNLNNNNNNNILINSNSNSNYLINNNQSQSKSMGIGFNIGTGIDELDYLNQNTAYLFESMKDKDKDKEKIEKIIKFIEKIKSELKKEKNRNNKIIAEFNKILLDRKKLEGIFIDCYEETRRDIFQRKMRDTMQWKNAFLHIKNYDNNNNNYSFPNIGDIKFENFQILDKKKLLEKFLLSDEVLELIKNNLGDNPNENIGGAFFQKPNFGKTFNSFKSYHNHNNNNKTSSASLKIKSDLKYINDLIKGNNSKSMNFTRTIFKK